MTDVRDHPIPTDPADDGAPSGGADRRGTRPLLLVLVAVAAVLAVLAGIGAVVGRGGGDDGGEATGESAGPVAHDEGPAGHDHPADGAEPVDDGAVGTGGHVHGEGPAVPLDAETQRRFTEQMIVAREATMRYPTVADATAAGLRRIGTYAPGSGAHYMQGMPGPFEAGRPTMWLYAGNEPTSPVVGLMYYSLSETAPPEGFAGPNDHWHQHSGLCLKDTPDGQVDLPLPVDRDVTPEQCQAVDGRFMDVTGWMIHVWTAPGWESPEGVFSHDHPLLVCSDGKTAAEAQLHVGCRGMA